METEILVDALSGIRRAPSQEKELHALMGQAFDRAGILFEREVATRSGPVDFVVAGTWALEVKIKGSGLTVARQITRYLEDERFAVGVIVTTKAMVVPVSMAHGKPVHVIGLWKNFL